ncbi:MAG: transporter substrate-binding domain-containing protein [Anaerotardibacter sp.]
MKPTKLLVFGLVVALCASFVLCGCSSSDYSPEKKEQTISSSALKEDGVLKVGVDSSSAPYAVSNSGSLIGFEVDIAAALADEMGLELELVDIGSDVAKGITTEDVDIVVGATTKNDAYELSDSYLSTAVCLFSTDATAKAPADGSGDFMIAAQASSMSAFDVTEHYGETHLVSVSNLTDAFTKLSDGSVKYAASDSVIGSYAAHSEKVSAYPIAILGDRTYRCVAVASGNTELLKEINTAISNLSKGGMFKIIEKKWLGTSVDISGLEQVTAVAAEPEEETEEGEEGENASTSGN